MTTAHKTGVELAAGRFKAYDAIQRVAQLFLELPALVAPSLKDVLPAWTLAKCVRAVPLASHSSAPANPCASQVVLLLGRPHQGAHVAGSCRR